MTVLSPQQVYQVAEMAFGDLGPEYVDVMARIALAESGGNTAAYNGEGLDDSHGLWQININPAANPDLAGYDLTDPIQNAQAARIILDRQGPQAWTTYTGGAYLNQGGGGGGAMPGQEGEDGNWWDFLPWDGALPFVGGDDDAGGGADPTGGFDPFAVGDDSDGPVVRTVGGVLYQYDEKLNKWTAVAGNGAESGGSGFTLSPGSSRFGPDGKLIASVPARDSNAQDPRLAAIWQQEYATKTTIDNFLQNKYDFEVRTGQTAEAAKTRQQLFSNNLAMQKLQMDMAKQQRDEQYRQATFKADLASKIGSLAANSGDRGEYAAFQLANGMWNGQQETKLAQGEDFHTEESLAPLNDLLGIGSKMGLGTTPAATAGAPASLNPINALPTLPNSMTASSKVAPQMPAVEPPPADGQNPTDLPLKAAGGIEDGAYISGEAGPEINIPLADGRTAILNADQARSVGINLDRVVKMATGGIFDSMAKDPASKFIDDAFNKAKAGTPWQAFNTAPTPIAAATPGMDPEVMKLMASLSQLKTGMPGSSFLRTAALLQPQGVNEGAIRRTA